MMNLWRNHSLTVVMVAIGCAMTVSGCKIENRGGSVSWLEPPAPIVIETRAALVPDEPVFRILDIYGGRMRLLVQDPITRHYKMVGP
jgi:hypothetical protein